ncbi:MAG: hypothetical protein JW839_00160 [Candidatus Lokiarchaeota archaeon]|nr:hypothetical protein [Candidatus Lokiarchaeota archaeon]
MVTDYIRQKVNYLGKEMFVSYEFLQKVKNEIRPIVAVYILEGNNEPRKSKDVVRLMEKHGLGLPGNQELTDQAVYGKMGAYPRIFRTFVREDGVRAYCIDPELWDNIMANTSVDFGMIQNPRYPSEMRSDPLIKIINYLESNRAMHKDEMIDKFGQKYKTVIDASIATGDLSEDEDGIVSIQAPHIRLGKRTPIPNPEAKIRGNSIRCDQCGGAVFGPIFYGRYEIPVYLYTNTCFDPVLRRRVEDGKCLVGVCIYPSSHFHISNKMHNGYEFNPHEEDPTGARPYFISLGEVERCKVGDSVNNITVSIKTDGGSHLLILHFEESSRGVRIEPNYSKRWFEITDGSSSESMKIFYDCREDRSEVVKKITIQ